MKRFLLVVACISLTSASVQLEGKEVRLDPFFVFSPRIMAQGGSFTSVASGHEALYTNPAGFISKKRSFTLLSLTGWAFMDPLLKTERTEEAAESYDWLRTQSENGFGGGASVGISYVGRGIGFGFIGTSNLLVQGDSFPFGLGGTFSTTLALVGGYAHPFSIGPTRLILGADLRPMIRGYSTLDSAAIGGVLGSFFDDQGKRRDSVSYSEIYDALNRNDEIGNPTAFALQGTGLGIDLGAKWEIGAFTFGAAVRDLFNTRISMFAHPLGDYAKYLRSNYSFPSNADATEAQDDYYIPMTVNVGAAFHPDTGKFRNYIDPTVHFEMGDLSEALCDSQSALSALSFGAEFLMFRFLSLRGGLCGEYASAGVGLKLFFLDLGASVFTQKLGSYAVDRPVTGVSFEATLRF
jgi:hypothetical protein